MNMNHKSNYCRDGVFDSFDLKEYFSQPINIYPTPEANFLYKNDLHSKTPTPQDNSNLSQSEIIKLINNNHFGIKIQEIEIEIPNEYTTRFIDIYTPLNLIGQGSFGLVISVMKKATKQIMAVKIIKKNFNLFDSSVLDKEVSIFKALQNNTYTIKLYDVIETPEYLFMFMDLIEGGSLKDFILERYKNSMNNPNNVFCTDQEVRIIMKGIIKAIQYLHKNNVMHRDLKPENILFRNKHDLTSVIIGDFGIADDSSKGLSINHKCGTLIYMAPEMLTERPYDQLIDSWACGIILYILESGGKHPIYIQGMDRNEYIKKLKDKKDWAFDSNFPNLARNFFLKLCKSESCARYHTHKALKHPWIMGYPDTNYFNNNVKIPIPLTFIEEYTRNDKIKLFKNMLSCTLYFNIFKSTHDHLFINRKNRTATYNFTCPFETPKFRKKSSSIHLRGTTSKKIIEYNSNAQPIKKVTILLNSNNPNTSQKHSQRINRNISIDNHVKEIKQHLQQTQVQNKTNDNNSHNNHHNSNTNIKEEQHVPLLRLRRNGSTGMIRNLFKNDKLNLHNNENSHNVSHNKISSKNVSVLKDKKNESSHLHSCIFKTNNRVQSKEQQRDKEKDKHERKHTPNKIIDTSSRGTGKLPTPCPIIHKKHVTSNLKKHNQIFRESSYIGSNSYRKKKIILLATKNEVNSFNIEN